jgi:basic membrane protein A
MTWVLDEHNDALISDEMAETADDALAAIATGAISVHDSAADGPCPAL